MTEKTGFVLPEDVRSDYTGPDARSFFAVWGENGALLATSSQTIARRLLRSQGERSLDGLSDTLNADGWDKVMFFLSQPLQRGGGRIVLTVGHRAWPGDAVLPAVEHRLMWETTLLAVMLGGCMALVSMVVIGGHLAPLRMLAQQVAAIGRAGRGSLLDPEGMPTEFHTVISEFGQAAARFEAMITAQQRYTADAAHQLLTPIGILAARLDQSGASIATSDVRTDIDRMTRAIRQLLSLARNARPLPNREPLDLCMVAEQVVAEMAPLAIAQGKELSLSAPDRPCFVMGDTIAIGEALANLIQNALDFTRSGESVDVRVSPAASISVLDRGPGCPRGYGAEIFNPFYSTRKSAGGTGLGLAIAREVMQAHEGLVCGEARSGSGSIFTLEFNRL